MAKRMQIVGLFFIALLVFTVAVYGAVSNDSSSNDSNTSDGSTNSTNGDSAEIVVTQPDRVAKVDEVKRTRARDRIRNITNKRESARICEDANNRIERISCRLSWARQHNSDYESPSGTVPEACRGLGNRALCQNLHDNVRECYDLNGRDKNRCFKRISGFVKGNLADEETDRPMKAKKYVVVLLSDLQEKIESAVEKGRIDEDKGAELIEKIVEIKQFILDDGNKLEARAMMKELRDMIRSVRSNLNDE